MMVSYAIGRGWVISSWASLAVDPLAMSIIIVLIYRRSVFYTSFRRAGFYGLYIWLTHTVMGMSASILPSGSDVHIYRCQDCNHWHGLETVGGVVWDYYGDLYTILKI